MANSTRQLPLYTTRTRSNFICSTPLSIASPSHSHSHNRSPSPSLNDNKVSEQSRPYVKQNYATIIHFELSWVGARFFII